jgi:prepilin peptidase CpaA
MALASVIFLLLGFAAWRDIATRTIPDLVGLAILVVGLVIRLPNGWAAVATSAAASAILFLLMLPFHHRGMVGGGDLKLIASLAFGLSPLGSYQMVLAIVLAGGVLAVVYLALRQILRLLDVGRRQPPRRRTIARRVMAVELWRIRKGAPLPYGLAIAAGALLVVGHQGG